MSRKRDAGAGAPTPARLKLDPDRCDRCGACLAVCERGALRVAKSYIFVDRRTCNGCYKCAGACPTGAIVQDQRAVTAGPKPQKRARTTTDNARGGGPAGRRGLAPAETSGSVAPKKPVPRPAARASSDARSRAGEVVRWSMLEAGAMLAVVFAGMVLKDVVLNAAWADAMRPTGVVWLRVFVLGIFYLSQVAVVGMFARRRGVDPVSAVRLNAPDLSWRAATWATGAVLVLLMLTRAIGWAYGLAARAAGWEPPVRWSSDLTTVFGPDVAGFALTVLMVVVLGPIVEEVVFRGIIQSAFESRWSPRGAIGASALLFAAYHFNLWLFVPTLVLGAAAGWLVTRTRTLWPAIALHALYNVVPVAIAFLVM